MSTKNTDLSKGKKAPAKPQQGDDGASDTNNDDTDVDKSGASDSEGDNEDDITLESLDPKVKAFLESELAKTRKATEKETKRRAEEEAAKKQRKADEEAQKAKGEFETLYATEKEAHEKTQREFREAINIVRKIKAALKAEIPDPLTNYKRLIDTEDDDELIEDAKTLKKSFGGEAHRDGKKPPITPDGKGGKHSDERTSDEEKDITDEAVKKELTSGLYAGRM